ncbi:N-acetyltransferase [Thermoleophilia bacterium SCSIO 60948]|nr:N-acetyltransferase [Thermoleophilia bacterium SCSIO 60948]
MAAAAHLLIHHPGEAERGLIDGLWWRRHRRRTLNGPQGSPRPSPRAGLRLASLARLAEFTIRHAEPGPDAAACARIYAPYVSDSAISFEDDAPDAEEIARRIEVANASYAWLVSEDEAGVTGFAYAGQHRTRTAYRWAVDVSVYVDGRAKRGGVGRALYEALFGLLRRQGLRIACAGITVPNDASIGLHRALGFESIGVYRAIGWKHGAWRDVSWWQLRLGPEEDGEPADPIGPQRLEG